jgi:hypothetical protein
MASCGSFPRLAIPLTPDRSPAALRRQPRPPPALDVSRLARHALGMDELERRVAVVETALIWAFGLTDGGPAVCATIPDHMAMLESGLKELLGRVAGGPEAAEDAAKALRHQSDDASKDDRAVMLGAAKLLEDVARRWVPPFG